MVSECLFGGGVWLVSVCLFVYCGGGGVVSECCVVGESAFSRYWNWTFEIEVIATQM